MYGLLCLLIPLTFGLSFLFFQVNNILEILP